MPIRMQKDFFLQPFTFPRAGHGACKRCQMTISANNGSHVCIKWYTTCFLQFFALHIATIKLCATEFFDIVITANNHASFVKHILDSINVCFTLLGFWRRWGGGLVQRTGTRPAL